MGYVKTALYHVFLHPGVRDAVRDTLGAARFDSLLTWIGEPSDTEWLGYLWALDSLLASPGMARGPDTVEVPPIHWNSWRSVLLGLVMRYARWAEKMGWTRKEGRPRDPSVLSSSGEACFKSDQTGITRGRSTVGLVVSCVDYGFWSRVYEERPGVFKRARKGWIGLSETRVSVIDLLGITSCPGGRDTCEGEVTIHQRILMPTQDSGTPHANDIVFDASETFSLALPVAVILPLVGSWVGGLTGAVVGAILGAAGAQVPAFIRIDRYRAGPLMPGVIRDTVDFNPDQPPPVDELMMQWSITFQRRDTGDLLAGCVVSKSFRSDMGPTDPSLSLGYCHGKTP